LHGGGLELAAGLTDEQRLAAGELRACAVRATHRLHEIVQVLGSADAAAELRPADESIDDLVRRANTAGLRVRLRHDGPLPAWSPMTSQAAHRVVQESLTNAARHAPGAPVLVTVAGTKIDVVNEAPRQPGAGTGTGQGLIGLDERVRLAGGRLIEAGPRQDGGWVVTAVLPDGAAPHEEPPAGASAVRQTRRRLLRTAALPVTVGLALILAFTAVQVVTMARTGIADDRYDRLRPGQSRADVELPPHDIGHPPKILTTPPEPAGATCEYYSAGASLLGPDPGFYQLCFAGDVLVSKRRLAQG
jgi:hypothetical protein